MKIYLDNCCYNRPFDDQIQERIHLESEAVLAVLQRGQVGIYTIIGSDILDLEIERMPDNIKKQLGMARFIGQYDSGHGDYTKEKLNEPDISLDKIDALLGQTD